MTYKASMDGQAIAITLVITVLFAVLMLRPLWVPSLRNSPVSFLADAGILVIYFGCYGFRPVSYTLTAEELVIHRILSNIHIPREDLETVEVFPSGQRGVFRTFAVGGLFGYFGKYAAAGRGPMTWYVTRKDRMILIELRGQRKIAISPDDRELFMSTLRES